MKMIEKKEGKVGRADRRLCGLTDRLAGKLIFLLSGRNSASFVTRVHFTDIAPEMHITITCC